MNLSRYFSLGRLRALITKEVIQMRRDRLTFAMMIGVPLMQLMLFGFAINSDPKGLPSALVAPTQDRFTRAMVSALETTGYYRFTHVGVTATEAEFLISRGDVSFVVTVPSDFGHRVLRGRFPRLGRSPPMRCCARRGVRWKLPRALPRSCRLRCIAATTPRASRSTTSCPASWG
jgi:ABC-2 type transport system permease protein